MSGNIDEGFWPEPTANVIRALEQFGGWSKYFARSIETIDKEDVICRQSDPNFEDMLVRTRICEQLEKEVMCQARLFRKLYPDKIVSRLENGNELKNKLRVAILKTGWKPDMNPIDLELKEFRKQRKGELTWLRKEKKRLRQKLREQKQRRKERKS
jgi:hypothetical protein